MVYFVVPSSEADALAQDSFQTLDEVKQFCKENVGEHTIFKFVGKAKTQRIEKVQSSFDGVVRKRTERSEQEEVKKKAK